MKNKLVISGIFAAIIVVVYFAFLYPWPNDQEVQGTSLSLHSRTRATNFVRQGNFSVGHF